MKVFISCTDEDLKAYRQAAIGIVNRYKDVLPAMEFLGPQPGEPPGVCEEEIRECDVFIGIYAHLYGYVPGGQYKSVTQQEYELAKAEGKECLCFIVKDDFPWNPKFFEIEKYPEIKVFLEKVKKENTIEFFKSPEDFFGKLSASLGNLITKQKGAAVPGKAPYIIPLAPIPYIAHPYPLPEHFIGRDAERAALSNWFFNEKKPTLVLEAIGGMGKSALSWVWLKKDIQERGVELDGVFWWSFYDEPFESFFKHLACYVMGKDEMQTVDMTTLTAALHERKFLLILDGLERALRGYAGMEAMFIQEKKFKGEAEEEDEWERRQREPVHPLAGRFLQALAGTNNRMLITSRLMPVPLEELAGVKRMFLEGLSPGDAVRFFRSQGIQGTRAELEQAGSVYDYHPLMLNLLTTSIKRSQAKDITEANELGLIDPKEPHKILNRGFELLSEKERKVATCVAVFRRVFTFDSAKALFPGMPEEELWQVLQELCDLGFLFFDESQQHFDFHPIMRSFLYNNLTERAEVHTRAVQYFQAVSKVEKVTTLEDLAPVIEFYHHLVKAGKFDEALDLFYDRLHNPCYYQLSTYHLIIELLKEIFPQGEDNLPRLQREADQAWALAALANAYTLSGQPAKAVPLYLSHNKLREKDRDKTNLAIGLGNAAHMAQIRIGQLSASTGHLRKAIALCREIKDEYWEAVGHLELRRVLAYQGKVKMVKDNSPDAEEEGLVLLMSYWEKEKDFRGLSIDSAYRSLSALLHARLAAVLSGEEEQCAGHSLEALEQAGKAVEFAEETAEKQYPVPADFVRAYWLLGEALVQCQMSSAVKEIQPFEIHFYDEPFQEQVETLTLKKGSEIEMSGRCLDEALRRCRKVNLVEFEPDILLALARQEWTKQKQCSPVLKELLNEAHWISLRCGYRLHLANLHLFCGQVLLEAEKPQTLLGLNAREHLKRAREYSLDFSGFSHLYQSKNPHFYDNIPEYEMLKRGMNKEARIKNGYYMAYQIAEALEERLV